MRSLVVAAVIVAVVAVVDSLPVVDESNKNVADMSNSRE
jgi:hypothetical protein